MDDTDTLRLADLARQMTPDDLARCIAEAEADHRRTRRAYLRAQEWRLILYTERDLRAAQARRAAAKQ